MTWDNDWGNDIMAVLDEIRSRPCSLTYLEYKLPRVRVREVVASLVKEGMLWEGHDGKLHFASAIQQQDTWWITGVGILGLLVLALILGFCNYW